MNQFQVDKQNINTIRIAQASDEINTTACVTFDVERFAFTANNLTYFMVGEKLGYWQFFPPIDAQGDTPWGVIPVWGIGKVTHSTLDDVEVGSRYFGYFPPATTLTMSHAKVSDKNLIDCSSHRLPLPQGYNLYRLLPASNGKPDSSQPYQDNLQMLLWPLFITSYCLWEAVSAIDVAQRQQVVIVSASSKTSLGLAFALKEQGVSTTGVTSRKNMDMVKRVDVYDEVISYDDLASLPMVPSVVVDMSGSAKVKEALTEYIGQQNMRYIQVGLTHWHDVTDEEQTDNTFFFAPAHIQQRVAEIGAAEFSKQSSAFIFKAIAWSNAWLKVEERSGLEALADDFAQHCGGNIPANIGRVYTLP
jgi:hypothetical protein